MAELILNRISKEKEGVQAIIAEHSSCELLISEGKYKDTEDKKRSQLDTIKLNQRTKWQKNI